MREHAAWALRLQTLSYMLSHWSRPKPTSSQGGWVIDSYLHGILLLITPVVLIPPGGLFMSIYIAKIQAKTCVLAFSGLFVSDFISPCLLLPGPNSTTKLLSFPATEMRCFLLFYTLYKEFFQFCLATDGHGGTQNKCGLKKKYCHWACLQRNQAEECSNFINTSFKKIAERFKIRGMWVTYYCYTFISPRFFVLEAIWV